MKSSQVVVTSGTAERCSGLCSEYMRPQGDGILGGSVHKNYWTAPREDALLAGLVVCLEILTRCDTYHDLGVGQNLIVISVNSNPLVIVHLSHFRLPPKNKLYYSVNNNLHSSRDTVHEVLSSDTVHRELKILTEPTQSSSNAQQSRGHFSPVQSPIRVPFEVLDA